MLWGPNYSHSSFGNLAGAFHHNPAVGVPSSVSCLILQHVPPANEKKNDVERRHKDGHVGRMCKKKKKKLKLKHKPRPLFSRSLVLYVFYVF